MRWQIGAMMAAVAVMVFVGGGVCVSGASAERSAKSFDIAAAMEESASYREVCEFLDDYLASQTPECRMAAKTICLAIARCTGPDLAKVEFGRTASPTAPPETGGGRSVPSVQCPVPGEQWRMSITQPGECSYPDGADCMMVLGDGGVIGLHFVMESAIDSCPCLIPIGVDFLDDDFLEYIGRLTTLEYLDLGGGGGRITDAGTVHLRGLHALRELTFDGSGRFVASLNADRCDRVTLAGLARLDELERLERLELGGGAGGVLAYDAAMNAGDDADGAKTVRFPSPEESRAFFRLVRRNPGLRQLDVAMATIDAEAVAVLAGCERLETLKLMGVSVGGAVPDLRGLPGLQEYRFTLIVRDGAEVAIDFSGSAGADAERGVANGGGWPELRTLEGTVLARSPQSPVSMRVCGLPKLTKLHGRIISDGAIAVEIADHAALGRCLLDVRRYPDAPLKLPSYSNEAWMVGSQMRKPGDPLPGPPPVVRVHGLPNVESLQIAFDGGVSDWSLARLAAPAEVCVANLPKLWEAICKASGGTMRLEMGAWPADRFSTGNLASGSSFPEDDAPWKESRSANIYAGLTWNGSVDNRVFPELLRRAPGLRWLRLADTGLAARASPVTDEETAELAGVFDAIAGMANLRKISFHRCTLTPDVVTRIGQHPTLSEFESLESSIPDRWENLPNIKKIKIHLDYGPWPKDDFPSTVRIANVPKLRDFYIYSQNLRTIIFEKCPSINKNSRLHIQGGGVQLIDLRGTNVPRGAYNFVQPGPKPEILYPGDRDPSRPSGK